MAQITILGTNDIHGGVEPSATQSGSQVGGLAFYAGVVRSIRQGIKNTVGDADGGVLVVDAGDQFQGTLLSNFDEGKLMFSAMSIIGYDVAIPGNHDYDFGPVDPKTPGRFTPVDQVQQTDELSLRGAFREAIKQATFPMISANTFFKASIADSNGNPIQVDGTGCKPSTPGAQIDWSRAKTLDFLKPYVIKTVAGVRVALIGLDNPGTPTVTTPHNVSDLCFDDEAAAYLRIRKQLDGQADVFVAILHDGNINQDMYGTKLLDALTSAPAPAHGSTIDAVIAGHTHTVNNVVVRGVPLIQSGANGKLFGRIDLFFNRQTGMVDTTQTRHMPGIPLSFNSCPGEAQGTCTFNSATGKVSYEGVEVQQDPAVLAAIAARRAEIAPIAAKKLGVANATVDNYGSNGESAMADQLTDYLRITSTAEIAFMNNGGIRTSFDPLNKPSQDILYEDLFKVLPFSNHGVVLGPMKIDGVLSILLRNAKACSGDGGMSWSGISVTYQRKCRDAQGHPVSSDPNAVLSRVQTVGGELIIENNKAVDPNRVFKVATLDFLQAGGSGYTQFVGVPMITDMGIVRDVIADLLSANPPTFSSQPDGRVKVEDRP
jgi:5'-nucleotidase